MAETYYATVSDAESLPPQYEWYQELESAKVDIVDLAEEQANETFLLYEITVRPLYRTHVEVRLDKV